MKHYIILLLLFLISLNTFSQDSTLINSVINQLNLDESKVKRSLIVSKTPPNNTNETIVVIPEIVDEGEHYFELNSHILIVNATTGKIINTYFESFKTNNWFSDAIVLTEIKIDTAPYTVSDENRAFGIRVYYIGSSRANPHNHETISLFIKSGNTLKKILDNYDVMNYGGEWDTDCYGEFIQEDKLLIISNKKTNGFFDILVKTKITETENFIDKNNNCDHTETVITVKTVLKFNNKEYK